MGKKGAKLSDLATEAAQGIVEALSALGDVASKKMFGGFGVFESGVMFALIDSTGAPFLRMSAGTETRFAERHGRMPYGLIPAEVLADETALLKWAREALEVARAARKK